MTRGSTLGLFALVAVLGAVVYFERGTTSSGDLEDRDGRFVASFVRDKLSKIIVVRRGETIEIARNVGDAGIESFEMVRPVRAREVDDDAVENFVSGLEWAETAREVGAASAAERTRFGLDRPRVRVTLVLEGRQIELAFGADEPTGRGVYATSSDVPDVVVVVGKDVFEAVDHDASAFRVRRLLASDLTEATRISVRTPQGVTVVAVTDGVWWTEGPLHMHAARDKVDALATALRELTALRFAPQNMTDSASGLSAPFATVEASFGATRVLLVIGAPCEAGRYVRVDRGPVACIADESVALLVPSADALSERRLVAAANEQVKGLTLTDPVRTLEVTENEGAFTYKLSGTPEQTGPVEAAALADLLDALRGVAVVGVRGAEAGVGRTFTSKLTIALREGPSDVLEISSAETPLLARRPGELAVLELPESARALLTPSALPLMRRALLEASPEQIAELTIARAGVPETIRRGEGPGDFLIVSPVSVHADTSRTSALFVRLAALEAVRFVAPEPLPEHGLGRTSPIIVTLKLSEADHGHDHGGEAHAHTLAVGTATEGGAFARLDAGPVFVLSATTLELLQKPLVQRTLLATEALYVDKVEIANGLTMQREGNGFVGPSGPVPAATHTALLDALADLDAVDVAAYGVPAESGLARPRARVTITRGAEAPAPARYVLLVGADVEGGRTHVRREDLAIDFLVRTETVSALLGATAPAP